MAKTTTIIKAAQQVKAPKPAASSTVWEYKVIVVFALPKRKVFAYIEKVKAIILGLTGNLNFLTPNPTLIQLNDDIDDLSTKATKAMTKGYGLVGIRDASFREMDADMDDLKLYMQGIINTITRTVSPEAAVAAAQGANVRVKVFKKRSKNKFTAEQVKGTYSVALTGTADTSYISHNWTVVSSDPTELIRIAGTSKAKTVVQDLKKGNSYTFYHYPVTVNGELPPESDLPVTIV